MKALRSGNWGMCALERVLFTYFDKNDSRAGQYRDILIVVWKYSKQVGVGVELAEDSVKVFLNFTLSKAIFVLPADSSVRNSFCEIIQSPRIACLRREGNIDRLQELVFLNIESV